MKYMYAALYYCFPGKTDR